MSIFAKCAILEIIGMVIMPYVAWHEYIKFSHTRTSGILDEFHTIHLFNG